MARRFDLFVRWFFRWGWMAVGYVPFVSHHITRARLAWLKDQMPGCVVHEGYARNCVLNGVDRSDELYQMFMNGSWGYVLITLPVTLAWSALIFVVLLWRGFRYLQGKRTAE